MLTTGRLIPVLPSVRINGLPSASDRFRAAFPNLTGNPAAATVNRLFLMNLRRFCMTFSIYPVFYNEKVKKSQRKIQCHKQIFHSESFITYNMNPEKIIYNAYKRGSFLHERIITHNPVPAGQCGAPGKPVFSTGKVAEQLVRQVFP
jgi:hypothetical protein